MSNTLTCYLRKYSHSSCNGGAGQLQLGDLSNHSSPLFFPTGLWPEPHQHPIHFHRDTEGLLPDSPGPSIPRLFNKDWLPLSPVLGTKVRPGQQTKLNPPRMSCCHLGTEQPVRDTPSQLYKSWGERRTRVDVGSLPTTQGFPSGLSSREGAAHRAPPTRL